MLILGIDTSCDDTSAAVVKNGSLILSNIVSSQINIHQKYGGVVPEVAARQHIKLIIPVIKEALKKAKIKKQDIDCLAVTNGPGLITSLMVGIDTAKSLAYSLNKKIIAINHLEGHIYSNWLNNHPPKFPLLCLIVSGGHTQLVLMKNHLQYQTIGQTRDDAAGEAFDKVAKLLNLGYPGGPIISKLANLGNSKKYPFSPPMIKSKNLDFSFSGLKTEVLYLVKKCQKLNNQQINNICASFQKATVDVLVAKTIKATQKYKPKTIIIGGGVAANKLLRQELKKKIKQKIPNAKYQMLNTKYCSDNAAMIAAATYQHTKRKKFSNWKKIIPLPNLQL